MERFSCFLHRFVCFIRQHKWSLFVFFDMTIISLAAIVLWVDSLPSHWGIPILEYHMITEETDGEEYTYNVPPKDFKEQLEYLQREGYTTITMQEFMRAKKGKFELPNKPIILTFDDGYKNCYTKMLPILETYNMKATLYMIVNEIGKENYLTWNELRDMQERGVEIGSHTANHIPLTELSREKQQDEMYLSKLLMEWNGIHTVFSFSYPNGYYDDEMPAMLKKNEYLNAVTGDPGLNDFNTDPYLMQRVNIPHPKFGITEFKYRLWKAEFFTKLGIFQHRLNGGF